MNNTIRNFKPPRHALDMKFHKRVHKELSALLNGKIVDDNGNVIGRWIYSDGNVALQFKAAGGSGSLYDAGEWDPAASYPDTTKGTQALVSFTPDGGAAGEYISLQTVPPGVSPDTGAPFWRALSNSSPGMWM